MLIHWPLWALVQVFSVLPDKSLTQRQLFFSVFGMPSGKTFFCWSNRVLAVGLVSQLGLLAGGFLSSWYVHSHKTSWSFFQIQIPKIGNENCQLVKSQISTADLPRCTKDSEGKGKSLQRFWTTWHLHKKYDLASVTQICEREPLDKSRVSLR